MKDHGIPKQALRRSARLQAIRSPRQSISKSGFIQEIQILPSTLHTSNVPVNEKALQSPPVLGKPSKPHQKRIREHEAGNSFQDQNPPPSKRPQTSPSSCTSEERAARETCANPILFWSRTGRWPKKFFEQDSEVREDFERGRFPEEYDWMHYLDEDYLEELPRAMQPSYPYDRWRPQTKSLRTKSSTTVRRKKLELDQSPWEFKSAPYRTLEYTNALEEKGSYMRNHNEGCKNTHLSRLLYAKQPLPQESQFDERRFGNLCRDIQGMNEGTVLRLINTVIDPSIRRLRFYFDADHLNHLEEAFNEGWNSAIPFLGPRPQPDHSVGFGRSAFTGQQFEKLKPFIGDALFDSTQMNFFMATPRIFFPFLTCEVKGGAGGLTIADRQNAHSATVAVRGVVGLFQSAGRSKDLHREILAFSISHDDRSVRIFGHYPIIEEDKITFYRHTIKDYPFAELEGKEKWTIIRFLKNVYDIWMPIHHKRICSAIDDLPPDVEFTPSQAASFSQTETSSKMPTDQPARKKRKTEITQLKDQLANQETKTANLETQIAEILGLMKDQGARQDKPIAEQEKPHKSGWKSALGL